MFGFINRQFCFNVDGARNTMILHVVSLIVLAITGSQGIECGICFQTRDVTEASIVFGGLFDVHQSGRSSFLIILFPFLFHF